MFHISKNISMKFKEYVESNRQEHGSMEQTLQKN